MQYRRDPITGDWIIINQSPAFNQKPGLINYVSDNFTADDDLPGTVLYIEDGFSYTDTTNQVQIENFFRCYMKRINSLKQNHEQIFITNILKPHCSDGLSKMPSEIFFAPSKKDYTAKYLEEPFKFFEKQKRCSWCDTVKNELKYNERLIFEKNGYVVFEPFAPRFPFETIIIPATHTPTFDMVSDNELAGLADVCHTIFRAIKKATCDSDFSLNIENVSIDSDQHAFSHWNIHIIPWMNNWAGFEVATGMNINVTTPESCAEFIREII